MTLRQDREIQCCSEEWIRVGASLANGDSCSAFCCLLVTSLLQVVTAFWDVSLLIKTPNRAVKIAAEAEMKKDDDDHEILEIITARHHSTYQPCDNTTQPTLH